MHAQWPGVSAKDFYLSSMGSDNIKVHTRFYFGEESLDVIGLPVGITGYKPAVIAGNSVASRTRTLPLEFFLYNHCLLFDFELYESQRLSYNTHISIPLNIILLHNATITIKPNENYQNIGNKYSIDIALDKTSYQKYKEGVEKGYHPIGESNLKMVEEKLLKAEVSYFINKNGNKSRTPNYSGKAVVKVHF